MGYLYETTLWKQRHDDVCGLVEFPIICAKWLVLCPPDPGAPLCAWWKTKQETSMHSSRGFSSEDDVTLSSGSP